MEKRQEEIRKALAPAYPDFSNDCVFPSDWSVDTLYGKHRSRPYNPNIAAAFFRAGYVETWGRGIQKICEACEQHGVKEPEYIVHSEDIILKINALQTTAQLSELERKIIEVIREKPDLAQRKIAEEVGETYSAIRYHMDKMIENKIILMESKGRKVEWIILDKA